MANTKSPCIIVGRKGSFGKINYSSVAVFAIDTTFFIDDRYTSANLRWLYFFYQIYNLMRLPKTQRYPALAERTLISVLLCFRPLQSRLLSPASLIISVATSSLLSTPKSN